MAYRLKYDSGADVLLVLLKEKGKLSYAEEVGDVVLHVFSPELRKFYAIESLWADAKRVKLPSKKLARAL